MTLPGVEDASEDPVWAEALDWLLKVNAAPQDAALQHRLKAWLDADAAHAAAYRRAQRVWRITGGIQPLHESRASGAVASTSVAGRPATRRVGNHRPGRRRLLLAAAALAGVAVIPVASDVWRHVTADYVTGVGETREIALDDGSRAELGPCSALKVEFSVTSRDVRLVAGEGFFTVTSRDARPFSVMAGMVKISVIGTAFNVSTMPDALDVSVQSGVVLVRSNQAAHQVDLRLEAGDQVRIDPATGNIRQGKAPPGMVGAWRQGYLVVRDAAVTEVIDAVRRYYHGMIVLADADVGAQRISGSFHLHDPIAVIRAAVEPNAGAVRVIAGYLVIVSSG